VGNVEDPGVNWRIIIKRLLEDQGLGLDRSLSG
jgi:hypothetical protein